MYCPKCGTRLNDDALFCNQCGARVERAAAPAPVNKGYQSVQTSAKPSPGRIPDQLQSYTQLGGFLKFIVIMYKYIAPILLSITIVISSITYINVISALNSISGYVYYDTSGTIAKSVVSMIFAIAIGILGIVLCIKFSQKLEKRQPDFLFIFQLFYIIVSGLLVVSHLVSGGNVIASIISDIIIQVIAFLIWNTYFTKSVRVAVYMGSDAYLRKSIFNKNTLSPLSK